MAVNMVRGGVYETPVESVLPATWEDAFATVIPELSRRWSELTTSAPTS
jgi:hypothetical protein